MTLSPSLSLSNTLLVPSLSNRLMSVSQVTADLNGVVLMYSTFCLLQDILTKEIIGRGTKRVGLYYVGDFSSGRANIPVTHASNYMGIQIGGMTFKHRKNETPLLLMTTQLVTRKDRFGYGTIDLGIHHLGI